MAEGLSSLQYSAAVTRWVEGQAGEQTLEEAVAAAKAAKAIKDGEIERRDAVMAALTGEEGLAGYLWNNWYLLQAGHAGECRMGVALCGA